MKNKNHNSKSIAKILPCSFLNVLLSALTLATDFVTLLKLGISFPINERSQLNTRGENLSFGIIGRLGNVLHVHAINSWLIGEIGEEERLMLKIILI